MRDILSAKDGIYPLPAAAATAQGWWWETEPWAGQRTRHWGHLAGDTAQGRPGRFPCPSLFAAIPGAGVLEHRLVPQSCWYLPEQAGSTGAGVLLVPPVLPALLQAQALN